MINTNNSITYTEDENQFFLADLIAIVKAAETRGIGPNAKVTFHKNAGYSDFRESYPGTVELTVTA